MEFGGGSRSRDADGSSCRAGNRLEQRIYIDAEYGASGAEYDDAGYDKSDALDAEPDDGSIGGAEYVPGVDGRDAGANRSGQDL